MRLKLDGQGFRQWVYLCNSYGRKRIKKKILTIYVDIDGTICSDNNGDYENANPIKSNIDKINKLYDNGHKIVYWTARGTLTKINWFRLTANQLNNWGCRYHKLIVGEKPAYDLLICDKTKRIEEL